MTISGYALSDAETTQVVSAYAASNQPVLAVESEPGWTVVGGFDLGLGALCRLGILAEVSDASLTLQAKLFDLTENEDVSGSVVQCTALTAQSCVSGIVQVTGGRSYQIWVQVVGNAGSAYFGTLETAGLTE